MEHCWHLVKQLSRSNGTLLDFDMILKTLTLNLLADKLVKQLVF